MRLHDLFAGVTFSILPWNQRWSKTWLQYLAISLPVSLSWFLMLRPTLEQCIVSELGSCPHVEDDALCMNRANRLALQKIVAHLSADKRY